MWNYFQGHCSYLNLCDIYVESELGDFYALLFVFEMHFILQFKKNDKKCR